MCDRQLLTKSCSFKNLTNYLPSHDDDKVAVQSISYCYTVPILQTLNDTYCKTHYYRAPFNFTHFLLDDDNAYITGADIRSK